MELRQIEYFLKVAETEHMTRAAESLHIAQPALSKTIKNLEEDLGLPLFDRVGNRIELNEAGKIFLEYARRIRASAQNARRELNDYRETESATILIHKEISFEIIYLAILEFSRLYPTVRFEMSPVEEMDNPDAKHWDFRLYSTPEPVDTADSRTVLTERIQLGVPLGHRLAGRRGLSLTEVKNEDFLFTTPLHSTMNDVMMMHCRLLGFTPRQLVTAGTKEDIRYMLKNGLGVSFIPEMSWYYMTREDGFALVPIEDPVCTRCINIGWKNSGYVSKAAVLFRDFILDFLPRRLGEIRREACPAT